MAKKESYYDLNQSQINTISDSIKTRLQDNENIIELFPDIELAIQILVSSIISPKDMVKSELIYRALEPIFPAEVILKLNTIVSEHFENYYNIKNDLQKILRDTLFTTGSYVKAILPESIVDELINQNKVVSTESLTELFKTNKDIVNLGILGNPGKNQPRLALERFNSNSQTTNIRPFPLDNNGKISLENLVEVTDNYKLLKLPKVIDASNKAKLKSIIKGNTLSLEADKLSTHDLSTILYKTNSNDSQPFIVIPSTNNTKRKSVGRPLVLQLPSESVIPVYTPGSENKHIGYFVLVDSDGNPLTINSNKESVDGLSSLLNNSQGNSLSSSLIQKAKTNLVNKSKVVTIDDITRIYGNIIETDLVERLNNGLYGSNVSVANNEAIYRIMLARSLSSKYTRLIFIPAELTTYFAFKYFTNGVGKSYLDDIKVLTSLRAIMLFAKVMALTKNSINLTHVNITLDPNDPDPEKTLEVATHEVLKMRQQYFPLGTISTVDLVDWIQRAGFEFSFEGHPGLPQTKFDFESKNLQHTVPDSDLDELLRKQTYMAMGLSPEVVDNGFNSEFATTVISNNILLSKRVIQLQETFTNQLTDFCHKVINNDTIINAELKEVLVANIGLIEKMLDDNEKEVLRTDKDRFINDLIERYVNNLKIDLPKPDITTLETQVTSYDSYVEALDKTLDAWINSEFITSNFAGNISDNVDSIKAVVKSYYIRRWMAENGFMPELNDIVTTTEDGKPTIDIYDINKNHMEGIIRSSIKFINAITPIKEAADKDLESLIKDSGDSSSDDTSSSDDNMGGNEEDGDDMSFDMPGDEPDEATTDDTSEEEEKQEEEQKEEEKVDEEETTDDDKDISDEKE